MREQLREVFRNCRTPSEEEIEEVREEWEANSPKSAQARSRTWYYNLKEEKEKISCKPSIFSPIKPL